MNYNIIQNENEKFYTDLEFFVGGKRDYYLQRFQKFVETDSKASWNWAAFFFPSLWIFYRKMIGFGIGYFVLTFLIGFLPEKLSMIGFLINILIGVFGNYIYFRHCEKKINEINAVKSGEEAHIEMTEKGGTSFIIMIVALVVVAIIQGYLFYRMGLFNFNEI